jgi:tetratricopeptide (TPR) repeat protein
MPHDVATVPPASPVEAAPGSKRGPFVLALGLVLLAAAVYANAVPHPFVYDDVVLVLKNPAIRSLANVPAIIGFGPEGFVQQERWVRDVSYALEYAAFGPWAPAYHFTNLVLHALVGLLVFGLVSRLAGDRRIGWWAAALFVVHPINTEVAANVSGRRELLATLFSLLTILVLLSWTRSRGVWKIPLAFVLLYLGVFSKEIAFLTPLAFVVVDVFAEWRAAGAAAASFAPWLRGHLARRKALYATLFLFAVVIGAVVVGTNETIVPQRGYYDTTGGGLDLLDRLGVVGLALRLLAFPSELTIDYSYNALGIGDGSRPLFALDAVLAVVGLIALAFGVVRRNWVGFAGAWMVVYFLPHTGIIAWHEIFAERFLYLPSIGFCAGLAAAGVALAGRPELRRAIPLVGCAALLALGTATVVRNRAWASPEALWSSAVERFPTCARAHKALGDVYLADTRPALAQRHYEEAVRILPTYLDARIGVAVAEVAQRRYALALETLEAIQARWPRAARAMNLEGYIHQTLGDSDAAMTAYQSAVDTDPDFADGYNNLAWLYVERGEIDEAVRLYKLALEHDPALVAALRNLATVYREAYKDDEQAAAYEREADRLEGRR